MSVEEETWTEQRCVRHRPQLKIFNRRSMEFYSKIAILQILVKKKYLGKYWIFIVLVLCVFSVFVNFQQFLVVFIEEVTVAITK